MNKKKYKSYYKEEKLNFYKPCRTCVYRGTDLEDAPCLKCIEYHKENKGLDSN